MKSKTWLVAVMNDSECLTAENLVGSRNYIGRLLEICWILASSGINLDKCEILLSRADIKGEEVIESWTNRLLGDDISKFGHAFEMAQKA